MRGYYGVGIFRPKNTINVGGLWRSAYLLNASFCFTVGGRYKTQPSDTYNTGKHVPLFLYDDFDTFYQHMPKDCVLVGVELSENAELVQNFKHPERAIYLLGAEDDGLPPKILARCHKIIQLSGGSFNVATAGSIVMYDRIGKRGAA